MNSVSNLDLNIFYDKEKGKKKIETELKYFKYSSDSLLWHILVHITRKYNYIKLNTNSSLNNFKLRKEKLYNQIMSNKNIKKILEETTNECIINLCDSNYVFLKINIVPEIIKYVKNLKKNNYLLINFYWHNDLDTNKYDLNLNNLNLISKNKKNIYNYNIFLTNDLNKIKNIKFNSVKKNKQISKIYNKSYIYNDFHNKILNDIKLDNIKYDYITFTNFIKLDHF